MSIVTLGVADLKRSREFYERLGWRRSMAKAEGDSVLAEAADAGAKLLKPAQNAVWCGFTMAEDGGIQIPD